MRRTARLWVAYDHDVQRLRKGSDQLREEVQGLGTDPTMALELVKGVYGAKEDRIPSSFLRDYAFVDAFPIDTNVREVLEKYELPKNSLELVAWCRRSGLRARRLTRASYCLGKLEMLPPCKPKPWHGASDR